MRPLRLPNSNRLDKGWGKLIYGSSECTKLPLQKLLVVRESLPQAHSSTPKWYQHFMNIQQLIAAEMVRIGAYGDVTANPMTDLIIDNQRPTGVLCKHEPAINVPVAPTLPLQVCLPDPLDRNHLIRNRLSTGHYFPPQRVVSHKEISVFSTRNSERCIEQ